MQLERPRILCVEDDEDTSFMLSTLLESSGYQVDTAGSVKDALRLAGSNPFDLHILDSRYPDGAGADLSRQIKDTNPEARILFYSGAAFDKDRDAAESAGACGYVVKPDIDGLLKTVSQLLGD